MSRHIFTFAFFCAALAAPPLVAQNRSGEVIDSQHNVYQVKKFPDGRWWITDDLKIDIPGSYCFNNDTSNSNLYGRLYTWQSAERGCGSLGQGWHLPSNEEWHELAGKYGGIFNNSSDSGRGAYKALLRGGQSGFNAKLGGNRDLDSSYRRLNAHGFYWTATQVGQVAWYCNFANGQKKLFLQDEGEKREGFSVRCVNNKFDGP